MSVYQAYWAATGAGTPHGAQAAPQTAPRAHFAEEVVAQVRSVTPLAVTQVRHWAPFQTTFSRQHGILHSDVRQLVRLMQG